MIDFDDTGLMPRTAHEYREVLRVAAPNGELDTERIDTWSRSRRTVLKAALKKAGRADLAALVAPAPKQKRKDLRSPTESEILLMREQYGSMPAGERAGLFLLLQMGLRSNEVLSLTRKEVERGVESGDLELTRKGDYRAVVPCRHAEPLLQELLDSNAKCGKEWKHAGEVFSCGGAGTQYVRLYKLTRSLGARIHFRGLRPHLLRHAFASQMIRRGAPLPVVQKALGHSDQQTTLRYVHADRSDVEKYVETWVPGR